MEWIPPKMSGETAPGMVSGSELRLVLLGSAESEKSAAGNIILNTKKNQTETSAVTQQRPHAFLLVIPVNQSTGAERDMLEKMEEMFGERWFGTTLILFTVTDEEQEKNIEDFVQSGNQEVQRRVKKCGNRFHCLNIHQSEDGSQVSELLEKIEKMMEGNIERSYRSEIYLEVESQIRAMERNIIRDGEESKEREKRSEGSNRKSARVIEEDRGND
ncbi:GTPase IMAP family member 7 [Triplophysa tibetana]|uniref:GTPase IMAP family member 7 n=1 Tax=Triplophysa tibetana TaxID=1572043 RepID=A0A5A9P683_9TELE|nr:GTPase IMAP family member 7 [Triplophysa tibetana]